MGFQRRLEKDNASLSPTVLPSRFARLVSTMSRSSTISLRLGTYIAEAVLDSARIGAITTIDVSKRAVEGLVFKAEEDVPDGGFFTNFGMSAINKTSTLAQLFASASFHVATSTVVTLSNLAQDSVHMIDSIFGSTESSRAIASIISLIRRELGDGASLYGLVSGLTCFSILQSRGWRRTAQSIRMRVLWDVVVLDTGETRTLEVKNPRSDMYNDLNLVRNIEPETQVVISTEEVTTTTTTVEVVGESPETAQIAIPKNAVVVDEEVIGSHDADQPRYKIMFQNISRKFNRKHGTGQDLSSFGSLQKITPATKPSALSSTPTQKLLPSGFMYEINDPDKDDLVDLSPESESRHSFERRHSYDSPRKSSLLEGNNVSSELHSFRSDSDLTLNHYDNNNNNNNNNDDDLSYGYQSPMKVSQFDDDEILPSNSPSPHELSISRRVSKSMESAQLSAKRNAGALITQQHGKLARRNSLAFGSGSTAVKSSSGRPSTSRQGLSAKRSGEFSQHAYSTSSSPSSPISGHVKRSHSSGSAYTLKTVHSQTSLAVNASEDSQIQEFPPDHICHNMAKYMRFASASYGQSFMRLLGIGMADRMFPSTDAHHAEHHAFANHTGVGLDHILLSSFTDSAIDKFGGIPLVHFVAVDHSAKSVVLTIRGTLGLEDVLTDLTCEYEEFDWRGTTYKAHRGMLRSAMLLKRDSSRVLMTTKVALDELGPDYGLVLCGHSLGGGVAALLSILISEPSRTGQFVTSAASALPPGRRIHSYAFGPPATITSDLRDLTRSLTTSVVYGLDIVPCLSLGVLRDFQSVALAFKADTEGVVEQIRKRVFAKLASRAGAFFDAQDDEYLWNELQKLRADMKNEKLVPPGEVYHLTTSTVFETHNGRTRKATRVVGKVIMDVEKRFGEPVFGRGIFHHSPVYYERALVVLERGICEDTSDIPL
ncbi:hypothetical protein V1514DRAFT_326555 [Lipomyces japonicus]|uniref:uncharacterized protein n=1 Tax=Lipomyces japonicus TaxID=56871 RepID=UPI0034CD3AB9